MPEESSDITARPFSSFNFAVHIEVDGKELADAAFSECDGLESTMEPKTYREGGNNVRQYQLQGPITYGQLTLKRGMTSSFDLWGWFDRANRSAHYGSGAKVLVEILSTEGSPPRATFRLHHCVPVKLRAPSLNAQEGAIAIEEMQLAYEHLKLEEADPTTQTTEKPEQTNA